jgi:hypothetical protein
MNRMKISSFWSMRSTKRVSSRFLKTSKGGCHFMESQKGRFWFTRHSSSQEWLRVNRMVG